MNEAKIQTITKEVLRECEDDCVALWWIVAKLKNAFGENFSQERIRELTLRVAKNLLASGVIEAGWPTGKGGWEPWRVSPEAALTRIESEWDALGEEPNIGSEIVWFTVPAKETHPKP